MTLSVLDLRFNLIGDIGASYILAMLRPNEEGNKLNSYLSLLLLPDNKISPLILADIDKVLATNRGRRGKKGKNGKQGKKGKKKKK